MEYPVVIIPTILTLLTNLKPMLSQVSAFHGFILGYIRAV